MSAARPPVSLKALIEALELQNDQMRVFVNPETAAVVIVTDEALEAAESPDGERDVDESEFEEARAVLASTNDTPCFLTFAEAFRGSQLNRIPIPQTYRTTTSVACA